MAGADPWLPLVVIGAGLVSAGFIRFLWPYRDRPGGWFFIGTIAAEAVWTLSYGLALLVFDPALRAAFEVPIWLGINFIGVGFLAFALEYTGRGGLVRSPWMAAVVGLQLVHTAVVATNPIHHVAWSGYRIVPTFGAATVTYSHTLWLAVNFAGIFLLVATGAFLLFDAFFSYGRLYRVQAAAVALSPVLPGLAFLLWLLEVGPTPPLNLTPLTFPVHLGLVFFAFFRRNMFELTPAARRASERTAIDDLPSAVLVVDDGGRLIDLNAEACRLLGVDRGGALGDPLEAHLPDVDPAGDGGAIALTVDGGRREYAVSTGALEDPAGRPVGHTVVLQDVTAERRREQRLGVLNRVLRHNLRNDLNVVEGHLGLVRDAVDDEELDRLLAVAEAKTADVIDLGETARRIEETVSTEADGAVTIAPVLERLAEELEADYPGATVEVDVPDALRLAGTATQLEAVFANLMENGVEHDPGDAPRVRVALAARDPQAGTATLTVTDDGPGLPDHELEVLDAEGETALEHGSGLGLWLVTWVVRALGGEVGFATDGAGTTVTLELPAAEPVTSS